MKRFRIVMTGVILVLCCVCFLPQSAEAKQKSKTVREAEQNQYYKVNYSGLSGSQSDLAEVKVRVASAGAVDPDGTVKPASDGAITSGTRVASGQTIYVDITPKKKSSGGDAYILYNPDVKAAGTPLTVKNNGGIFQCEFVLKGDTTITMDVERQIEEIISAVGKKTRIQVKEKVTASDFTVMVRYTGDSADTASQLDASRYTLDKDERDTKGTLTVNLNHTNASDITKNPSGVFKGKITDGSKIRPFDIEVVDYWVKGITASVASNTIFMTGVEIDKSKIKVQELRVKKGSNGQEISELGDPMEPEEYDITPTVCNLVGNSSVTINSKTGYSTTLEINFVGITRIEAAYSGGSVVVGKELDTAKLKVTAVYSNGTSKTLTEGYTLNTKIVSAPGENTLVVTYNTSYNTFNATFRVVGAARAVDKLQAAYIGPDLNVGSEILKSNVEVIAIYNDGTRETVYDFVLSTTKVEKLGSNTVTVTYGGKTTTFKVYAIDKIPSSLVAYYSGDPVIEGNAIDKNNIKVTAYYNDGTYEDVTNFTLSLKILNNVGSNIVTVTYKEVNTDVYITCVPRTVTSLTALYKGPEIVQNNSFSRDLVVVTATYNDNTVGAVTDFTLPTTVVSLIGTNTYTINYGGQTASFTVKGIAKLITGTGDMKADIGNEEYSGLDISVSLEGEVVRANVSMEVNTYEHDELSRVTRRASSSGKFIGFDIFVDGFEFSENQYMTVQVEIPPDFDPAKTAVYYTPNRKNVMARMEGGLIGSNVYEFYAYRDGCYILVECDEETITTSDVRDNKSVSPFLLIKDAVDTIIVGERVQLSYHVMYADAANLDMIWSVDDTDVAVITKSGVLRGKKAGTVNVTISTLSGDMSYTFQVKVKK